MSTPLNVLILEDWQVDAELLLHELRRASFDPTWQQVQTEADYLAHLNPALDIILADYSMPQFDAMQALKLLQERKLDIPFIIVTGSISEEVAVKCIKQGATDYLIKDRMARLGPAVQQALEQKQARDTKRQAEAQLHLQATALEAAANAIIITDPEGTILWVNPAFTTLTGYPASEAIGQNPRLLKSGEHDSLFYQELWETILSGQVWQGELINRRKDGSLYYVDQTITPVEDEQGEISRFVTIGQDITERKRITEALQQSEELFREVITSISPHIYVTEVTEEGQRRNRYLSPNIETLTGYPYEKFITDWSFWASVVIHPEDRVKAAEQAERLVMGQNSEVEYRMVRADGEIIWVRDSGRTKAQGASRMIYGVVSDITENRWAREEIVRLYTAERERYLEAEALRQAALALASTLNLNQVIERILVELQNVVPYDSASVQLLENEHHLKIIGGRGFPEDSDEIVGALLPTSDHIPNVSVLETREPVIVKDVQKEYVPFMAGSYENKDIRAWLGVPMSIGTRIIGMVTLNKEEPDFYTETHGQTAMAYAAQAAIAIENAHLHTETERRAQQLAVMHELDRAISASLHIDEVYQAFSDYTGLLLSYDRLSVVLLEEDRLVISYVAGLPEPAAGTTFPLAGTMSEKVIAHQKPELIKNVTSTDTNYSGEAVWGPGVKSVIVLPLQVKGQGIGTWNISSRQMGFYGADDLHIAQLIANQLAIGIENARLYDQARQEIRERQQAQEMLEEERASLAQRVAERTSELSTANAELARAARLKDEFLANMSHELRTPLNAILGMSEVLQMEVYGSLNDKQQDSLKHIEEGGRHLLALINDILDVSKIEAGKLELNLETIPVEDVCQASLRFVQQQALKKQIELVFDFDDNVKTLEVDERRLKQILVNLLTNAVKFTPSGGQVGLEVTRVVDESAVRFTVWDTGMGISKKDLQKLFRPFVQLDSSLTREHEGTGLGLVLVYRLAALHGGGVSVESQVGQGSRFTVSIPWRSIGVYRGKTDQFQAEIPTPINVSDTTADFPRPLILLAEDNQANLVLVQGFLEAYGYEVIVARNGGEAIERAREERPDLILMDIQMPGLDGLEAIRRIRADEDEAVARVPIVALTALAMAGDKERCLKAGANTYLSKPVSIRRLLELLQEFLKIANDQFEGSKK